MIVHSLSISCDVPDCEYSDVWAQVGETIQDLTRRYTELGGAVVVRVNARTGKKQKGHICSWCARDRRIKDIVLDYELHGTTDADAEGK